MMFSVANVCLNYFAVSFFAVVPEGRLCMHVTS